MFGVGDLVECISDSQVNLTKGKNYKVISIYWDGDVRVLNDIGESGYYNSSRFKLVEPNLKVGDKVKSKNGNPNVWEIVQISDKIAFIKEGPYVHPYLLSDLEKVEEREAPPKFTKVYVWDGEERPKHPKIYYSVGEFSRNGRLLVSANDSYMEFPTSYHNWEVCV